VSGGYLGTVTDEQPAEQPSTGGASGGIDSVTAQLDQLAGLELADHPAVFADIHDQLRATLASIDDA
jgi:hypothetical protein